MSEKYKEILIVGTIVALSILTYAGTLSHELVWDDLEVLRYIDSIVQEDGLSALVTCQFATHIEEGYVSGYYRPVTVASLWFDSILSPFIPFIYHLTNIILHALNTLLVFVFMRQLDARFAAAVGAIIFAVHPVHSESVSFVSGRADLWAALFILLAGITWIRAQNGLSTRPDLDMLIGFTAYFLACLSKEVAVMLPAVLLAWDAAKNGITSAGQGGWWSRNRSWVIGWAVVFAFVLGLRFLVFGADFGLVQARPGQNGSVDHGFSLLMTGQMLLVYLRLLVLPWPLRIYYGPAELQMTLTTVLGVCLFLAVFAFLSFRRRKEIAIQGAVWIGLFLVPVLGLAYRGGALVAERFLYLPSVGFSLLAGTVAAALTVNRKITIAVIGLLAALMMVVSKKQNAVWKNEVILFGELVKVAPKTTGGHYNLGNAYADRGMHLDAIRSYRRAIAIEPLHYQAWFNMGNALAGLDRYDEAIEAYDQALRIKPDLTPVYINLGFVLLEMGEYGRSSMVYADGLKHAPDDERLHLGLTLAYIKGGDLQAARDHQRLLESEDPELAEMIQRLLLEDKGEN